MHSIKLKVLELQLKREKLIISILSYNGSDTCKTKFKFHESFLVTFPVSGNIALFCLILFVFASAIYFNDVPSLDGKM